MEVIECGFHLVYEEDFEVSLSKHSQGRAAALISNKLLRKPTAAVPEFQVVEALPSQTSKALYRDFTFDLKY